MIGASLSEPHTSGTALQDACVCLLAAIYRKFYMRINISRKLNVLVHLASIGEGQIRLGYCRSAASATVAETAQDEVRTVLVCHGRLLADRTNYTHLRLRSLQVRAVL